MAVIINGSAEIQAQDRDKALAECAGLMEETRTQEGCLHYVWSADPTSDTRIYVYEKWQNSELLCKHLAGSYYAKMLAHMGGYGVHNVDVAKYKIAIEEPVYDSEGKPRGDFFSE